MALDPRPEHAARVMSVDVADVDDLVTTGCDHAGRAAALQDALAPWLPSARTLLAVGCGSGTVAEPWHAAGWTLTGADASLARLTRAADLLPGVPLHLHDACELPRLGAFGLVAVLGDVVDQLLDPADVAHLAVGVRRNLGPGGVAVLEVNTVRAYGELCAARVVHDGDDGMVAWRGFATDGEWRPGEQAEARFDLFARRDGEWQRHAVRRPQRHHPEALLRAALAGAGLRVVARWGHGIEAALEPLDDGHHLKATYVAQIDVATGR